MSLIFGHYAFQGAVTHHEPLEHQSAHIMEQTLAEDWRPDRTLIWQNDRCSLGQLTLFNTPESFDEVLPFQDHSHGCVIVADARIDNRAELSDALNSVTKNTPDGQIILAAYHKWQQDCVLHLMGDFAFVIWDEYKQQ